MRFIGVGGLALGHSVALELPRAVLRRARIVQDFGGVDASRKSLSRETLFRPSCPSAQAASQTCSDSPAPASGLQTVVDDHDEQGEVLLRGALAAALDPRPRHTRMRARHHPCSSPVVGHSPSPSSSFARSGQETSVLDSKGQHSDLRSCDRVVTLK